MNQFVIALIRTVVPAFVGSLFGWLASVGLALDTDTQAILVLALVAFFTGLYYAAVTWAASKWPAFGWLLGVAATPSYEGKPTSGATYVVNVTSGQSPAEIAEAVAVQLTGTTTVAGNVKFNGIA